MTLAYNRSKIYVRKVIDLSKIRFDTQEEIFFHSKEEICNPTRENVI